MVDQTNTVDARSRRRRTGRRILWTLLFVAVGAVSLPFTGFWLAEQSFAQEEQQAQSEGIRDQGNVEAAEDQRKFWKEARRGNAGYTAVQGQETDVLIQSGGQLWREMRGGWIIAYSGWILLAIIAAIVIFQLVVGTAKLDSRSGVKITRWTLFERVMHWYTAVLFIILAITGLSVLLGRELLIPLIGKEAFAAYAAVARPIHDYLALFFTVGLVLLIVPWIGQNIPRSYDWTWFRRGGGYVGSKGHPPAGFVNAGEKIWYWLLFFGSIALIISGVFLLFPNFGWTRETMQLSNIVHAVSGVLLTGFALGHIYLGTLGNEGSFEGMWTGEVDADWARQHHSVWYEEVKEHGDRSDVRPTQTTPAH